jgi:catechol 2,3-dioxygenase-like lactoylglutathione lyase family enzyme
MICKHIALFVPDLRAAEAYYRALFGMPRFSGMSPDAHCGLST